MRKYFIAGLVFAVVALTFLGGIFYWIGSSPEEHAARLVAQNYARAKSLTTDLSCKNGGFAWQPRGEYRTCCFVFEIRDRTQPYAILVRYTDTCPTNTFEVGLLTRANRYRCGANTEIRDAEYIKP